MTLKYPWTFLFLVMLLVVQTCSSDIDFRSIVQENANFYNYNYTKTVELCPLRIVGGIIADIERIPYQAAFREAGWNGYYWSTFCGGAIVTPYYVLTAAHCFEHRKSRGTLRRIRVSAGATETATTIFHIVTYEEHSRIKNYYEHPNFDLSVVINDLGLVELEKAFKLSNKVLPIRIHTADLKLRITPGTWCVVSGFGHSDNDKSSKQLRMVCVPVISPRSCKVLFAANLIHDSTLCAGSFQKDSCMGDSGGPLICQGVLVGLVSWGGRCGERAGVYTRISSYATGEYMPLLQAVVESSSHRPLRSWLPIYLCLTSIYFFLR